MDTFEDFEIDRGDGKMTRRQFVITSSAAAALAFMQRVYGAQAGLPVAAGAASVSSVSTAPTASELPSLMNVAFKVNGQARELHLDTRTTLLDALREHLHLTGSKKGCDHGQCGACTVLVGGRRINSCLTLAAMHQGSEITTIEGLGTPENQHPLQAAFVKCDGYQCGYCTPGQICSAVAMMREIKAGVPSHATADLNAPPLWSEAEVRERMSGNICRCGAYSNIFEAIQEVGGPANATV